MDLYCLRTQLQQGRSIYELALRVGFYARVSTDKYEQSNSLKNQVEYYTSFIKDNPNWIFVSGYIDEGLSGTSVKKRENFLRMMEDAKNGKLDFIVTKEISRFSRNTLDSIQYTQQLLQYGVGVLFQSDNINTLMPDSELRLTIMSSIAQEEVRKLSERVRFGFKRSIENGRVLGNNNILGYRKDNGRLMIDEKEAKIVQQIFELYVHREMGIRAVAAELGRLGYKTENGNDFSFSTVKSVLSNPKYKGYYCGNKTHKVDYKMNDVAFLDPAQWIIYKDEETVPPIISEELWERANIILSERGKKCRDKKTSYQNKYAFSGKIICAEHGTSFHRSLYKYRSGSREVWQCKRYKEKGKQGCNSPSIYTDELMVILKEAFQAVYENKADIIQGLANRYRDTIDVSSFRKEIRRKEQDVQKLISKKDHILELNIDGKLSNDEFAFRNDRYNQDIEELHEQIELLKKQEQETHSLFSNIETLKSALSEELDFSGELESDVVGTLIDSIIVYKTGDKKNVRLKIVLSVGKELPFLYRHGELTSVCCKPYI